nr:hypothetical protein [Oryza sativa Japonica Group]
MDEWLILQSFYNGLTPTSRDHLDAEAGGAFFSKTVRGAVDFIEKMVSNMDWSKERLQTHSHSRAAARRHASAHLCTIPQGYPQQRPLPTTKVVKLMEECSNAILHKLPEKKKGPGYLMITCSIETQKFNQALYDLGASVSIMPKDVFDKLNFTVLAPTPMRLQLGDSLVHYPTGIVEYVPVKIRDFFIPVDFVVLDMESDKETPIILGRPFVSTADTNIDVGTGSIRFCINGKEEKFEFQPRTEQCSMVRIKYGPNPQNIHVVEVEPPKTDSLVKFMQNFLEKGMPVTRSLEKKTLVKSSTPAKKQEKTAQKKPPPVDGR